MAKRIVCVTCGVVRSTKIIFGGSCNFCWDELARGNARPASHIPLPRYPDRTTWLEKTYGITERDYNRMHEAQDGRCAICRRAKKLHVDHHHGSGKVRGLLCNTCNMGLGSFQDDVSLLAVASTYLQENA
jgi:hypothetical protein